MCRLGHSYHYCTAALSLLVTCRLVYLESRLLLFKHRSLRIIVPWLTDYRQPSDWSPSFLTNIENVEVNVNTCNLFANNISSDVQRQMILLELRSLLGKLFNGRTLLLKFNTIGNPNSEFSAFLLAAYCTLALGFCKFETVVVGVL